jgi:hypothetical protein
MRSEDPGPGRVVLAIDDALLCAWAAHATLTAGIRATIVFERADLFDLAAGEPVAAVVGDRFDRAPCEHTLAALRTAGSRVPAIVLATWKRPALVSRLRALAPVELVANPFDGAALIRALRSWLAPPALRSAC